MINFDSKNDGTWFYFDKGNPDAGSICLRELSSEELSSIEKITTKSEKKVKRGVVFDDVKTDKQLESKLYWRYCIVDWKNIQIDGKKVKCDNANKDKLMKITDFVKFMSVCLEELTESNKSLEEARVKNSGTSVSGDSEE